MKSICKPFLLLMHSVLVKSAKSAICKTSHSLPAEVENNLKFPLHIDYVFSLVLKLFLLQI